MKLSKNTIERLCQIFGALHNFEEQGVDFISSRDLAKSIGATEYTVRKDISLLDITGFTRKGYAVTSLKEKLGEKLYLTKKRKACIIGLGRLGTALLDYEKFQEDGFEVVAGFDCSINKIERIRTNIDIFPVSQLEDIIKQRAIELGIITVPGEFSQEIADRLSKAGVKGILNFSPVKVIVPKTIIHVDMDFTNALRFIAAQFMMEKN